MNHESEISNLLGEGLTIKQVANKLGISDSHTRYVIRRAGITIPESSKKRNSEHYRIAQIASLMADGKTPGEIAETLGLTRSRVAQIQLKHGLRKPINSWAKRPGQIQSLLKSGASVLDIADSLGIKPGTVYTECSRRGISIPRKSMERKMELDAILRERLKSGSIDYRSLSHDTGLSESFLAGYTPALEPGRPKAAPEDSKEYLVVQALKRGESVDDVALSLNILPSTVVKYATTNGFSFRKSYVSREK